MPERVELQLLGEGENGDTSSEGIGNVIEQRSELVKPKAAPPQKEPEFEHCETTDQGIAFIDISTDEDPATTVSKGHTDDILMLFTNYEPGTLHTYFSLSKFSV